MKEQASPDLLEIRVFGSLRRHLERQDFPFELERSLSSAGGIARDIARSLGLPPGEIEAVFRNGRVINIHDRVFPGDRVAFFPKGTPGPYRVFLGMIRENIKRAGKEKS
ncbi:MAG: MoaD/ThiS family protein [Deltaproteobacteria bacterium]|nr:MoaD/ThiS family protein [Deltaproteobacteria bacterium]MBW2016971.1 MoaD/ThiS family protein [Deltaproteobacteria bacterium]MBW2129374.1 MoaD/ThiS family protein [Deltaproteobacteria bacterium]MBW2303715.1 MoaD/ThiS family protein [Deltaproteobacteria bacterium]